MSDKRRQGPTDEGGRPVGDHPALRSCPTVGSWESEVAESHVSLVLLFNTLLQDAQLQSVTTATGNRLAAQGDQGKIGCGPQLACVQG